MIIKSYFFSTVFKPFAQQGFFIIHFQQLNFCSCQVNIGGKIQIFLNFFSDTFFNLVFSNQHLVYCLINMYLSNPKPLGSIPLRIKVTAKPFALLRLNKPTIIAVVVFPTAFLVCYCYNSSHNLVFVPLFHSNCKSYSINFLHLFSVVGVFFLSGFLW